MTEPPRGRPTTHEERERVLATRMPGGSDLGGTRNAKQIRQNVRAAGRKAPPPSGITIVASATFGPTGTVALGDAISMDGTPQESHGDWSSYFDASSGVVTLLADGLYGFDAYVQGGSGFLTPGGLGIVGFAGYKGPAVVYGSSVWGQTHSGPAQWSASDTWLMTTAPVVNAADGIHANVWCQVYAYSGS